MQRLVGRTTDANAQNAICEHHVIAVIAIKIAWASFRTDSASPSVNTWHGIATSIRIEPANYLSILAM